MIETADGLHKEVTVVLLGHDQADHRARAIHYYRQAGVPCLALAPQCALPADDVFSERLSRVLDQVATPFVVLALDADFVLTTALGSAVACLRAHQQVLAVQGYALAYAPGNSQVAYHKIGSAFDSTVEEGARARLSQYALAGQQAWRAVLRVSALQAALGALPQGLDLASFRVALSYVLLTQGVIAHLDQTDVVCEYAPFMLTPVAREERLTQTVRALRQWDAGQQGLCADDAGFVVLNQFVRGTYDQCEAPLLFTSRWNSVIDDPERVFEPRQYVELPYYKSALFDQLTALEFLCHAWPTGRKHQQALEGAWVRQRELLLVQPNDTAETLEQRYWQALALGLFNLDVCLRLKLMLTGDTNNARVRELNDWLGRLERVPGIDMQQVLAATPSGQVLAAIAAAVPDEAGSKRVLAHLAKHSTAQIAFVVLDLADDDLALQATFDSLLSSGMRNFKLVVLKGGKPPAITTSRDTLHFVQVTESNWVAHLNQVVRQLPSEWMQLLQAGDQLAIGGLLRLHVELSEAPACQAICGNEVQRDSDGRLISIVRPGADFDLLRARPDLMSRHWLVRREAVLAVGGYSETCRQALEFDLLLRLVEAQGVGSLAHLDEYLVVGQVASEAMAGDVLTTLNRHLTLLGYRGRVGEGRDGRLHIDFRHSATPQVSILLPAGNDPEALKACLISIVQRTRYPRYEVLVACEASDAEAVASNLAAVQGLGLRVRQVASEQAASRSELINFAATQAQGEYLVLFSSHCQVLAPAWIEALLNQAQRPEVGVVGCQMYGRGGAISHAGYELLGSQQVHASWLGGTVEGFDNALGLEVVRGCQAVSADGLMVRKDVFEHCGGLPGTAGADIELSLQVAQAGLLVLMAPQAQLFNDVLEVLADEQCRDLVARWPHAFSRRVVAAGALGIDHSRLGQPVMLEWLSELA